MKKEDKTYRDIVAGTGFEGRADRIRAFVREGTKLTLKREPKNKYDPNAIAVYAIVKKWYLLFKPIEIQIGYIKSKRAEFLSKKMREGLKIKKAVVVSTYMNQSHPRVSIDIYTHYE